MISAQSVPAGVAVAPRRRRRGGRVDPPRPVRRAGADRRRMACRASGPAARSARDVPRFRVRRLQHSARDPRLVRSPCLRALRDRDALADAGVRARDTRPVSALRRAAALPRDGARVRRAPRDLAAARRLQPDGASVRDHAAARLGRACRLSPLSRARPGAAAAGAAYAIAAALAIWLHAIAAPFVLAPLVWALFAAAHASARRPACTPRCAGLRSPLPPARSPRWSCCRRCSPIRNR